MPRSLKQWHVAIAAEAIAAAQFARCGCDVLVQYGANQPEYDLVVTKGDRMMKVSVKGSQDGAWALAVGPLKAGSYHEAIDRWLESHGKRTVLCLVQFKGVDLDQMPRIYLARPEEVARRLHESRKGHGDAILYEDYTWGPRSHAAGTRDRVPDAWRFSPERVEELLGDSGQPD